MHKSRSFTQCLPQLRFKANMRAKESQMRIFIRIYTLFINIFPHVKPFTIVGKVHFASFAPPEKRDNTSVLNDAGTLGCFKDALRMSADSMSVCEMSLKR